MRIMATLNGQRRYVGQVSGGNDEEAIANFRQGFRKANGIEWDEDTNGKLSVLHHVPLYESHPSI